MTRTTTDHAAEIVREIRAKLNCADEKVADAIDAIYRKTAFEVEILVSQLQVIGSQIAADRARAQSSEFRGHVSEIIREANSQSRSEEHTSELQSLMRISYAVFCLNKKKNKSHKSATHESSSEI